MSLPKYKELENLKTVVDIDQEIFILQKNLFDLRIKRSTSQSVKPHLFGHAKRRIAQLKFKKSLLLKVES
jgi:ribosomal protein L29